jgi:lysophospholipase L1-like esterase
VLKARLRGLVGSILSPLRKGGGAAAPDTRDLKIVCVGNSLTVGFGTSHPYPDLLEAQLLAGGKTVTVVNLGHSGETTVQLQARIAAEVDPEYDPSKACVLVLWEGLNAMRTTALPAADAAQQYSDYIDALADDGWYVIIVTATPSTGAGTSGTYEARRLAFNAILTGDPTLGGRANALADVGGDARLQDSTSGYWYNADAIHFQDKTNGVVASKVIAAIRSIFTSIAVSPAHVPYPLPVLLSTSGLQDAGGAAPDDGENIATWVPLVTADAFNMVQGTDANRPSYDLATESVALTADERLASSVAVGSSTRYTFAGLVKLSAGGNVMLHTASGSTDVRFYANEGPGTFAMYAYDGTHGSLKTMPAGTLLDDAWHYFVVVCDATDASHKLYVDGVEVSLSTYLIWNTDPNAQGTGTLNIFGTGAGNGVVGNVRCIVKSPVPVNATERADLEASLAALV